jgi:hypothetical protein
MREEKKLRMKGGRGQLSERRRKNEMLKQRGEREKVRMRRRKTNWADYCVYSGLGRGI